MKRTLPTTLLFSVFAFLLFANYIVPILQLFVQVNYSFPLSQYLFVILSYLCIIVWVWSEKENLEEFHIDRLSLAILIIFGFFRGTFNIPFELYLKIAISILSILLLLIFIANYHKIPQTQPKWILFSTLSFLLIIPLAFLYSLNPTINPNSNVLEYGFLWNAARNLKYNLSFVSPFEEIIYRGILWGQLRRWGWTGKRIFWFQATLFWLLHFWQLSINPIVFFIAIPITTIALSLLVLHSRRVSSSIVLHTAINALTVLVAQFWFL